MMPSIYLYHNQNAFGSKYRRWIVIGYLLALIGFSSVYILVCSLASHFSSILTIVDNVMFDEIYRRPFGTVGYYALGILLSISYFEFTLAVSQRELRKRNVYRLLYYIG